MLSWRRASVQLDLGNAVERFSLDFFWKTIVNYKVLKSQFKIKVGRLILLNFEHKSLSFFIN